MTAYDTLSRLIRESGERQLLVGIDGCSGAGKSSLAARLSELPDTQVFHTDDFFLPPERKTPERLSQPGGNVDYERIHSELLLPLVDGRTFRYGIYSCSEGGILLSPEIRPRRVNILEGVYSLHPLYRDMFTHKVMLLVDRKTQLERIRKRSGEELSLRFEAEWIPLEDRYFEQTGLFSDSSILRFS